MCDVPFQSSEGKIMFATYLTRLRIDALMLIMHQSSTAQTEQWCICKSNRQYSHRVQEQANLIMCLAAYAQLFVPIAL